MVFFLMFDCEFLSDLFLLMGLDRGLELTFIDFYHNVEYFQTFLKSLLGQ